MKRICINEIKLFLPMIFAAVEAPTITDKFGAINAILLSTYSKILSLQLLRSTAMSQASMIASFSSSVNNVLQKIKILNQFSNSSCSLKVKFVFIYPCVVEAVTETTIIVAWDKNCCKISLFFALSKSFSSSRTVITYSNGPTTRDSNSGNLFEYLSRTNLWIVAVNHKNYK